MPIFGSRLRLILNGRPSSPIPPRTVPRRRLSKSGGPMFSRRLVKPSHPNFLLSIATCPQLLVHGNPIKYFTSQINQNLLSILSHLGEPAPRNSRWFHRWAERTSYRVTPLTPCRATLPLQQVHGCNSDWLSFRWEDHPILPARIFFKRQPLSQRI